ncbi:MAG: hypothetical protein M3134_02025 [Actinomycetota bacterium]|nr:hypothetical protein [Actinomycetota bacterium]
MSVGGEPSANSILATEVTVKASRYIRSASVLASAALILGAFVAPADAKKKKKPKTPPAPPACAPYTPGEVGAEAPKTVVTDAATAEAPVVVELEGGMGLGDDLGAPTDIDETSSVYQNIQVDSANPNAGLYVKIEFPDRHDFDLYLLNADGSTAANSGVFNPIPEGAHLPIAIGGGSPEGGWDGGSNYETVTGINTADCGGYTAQIKSYLTPGGAVTLSAWLGEALVEPGA